MSKSTTKYERLSHERKQLQATGEAPEWYTTASYQLLKNKNYLDKGEKPIDMYSRIAKRAEELTKFDIPADFGYADWFDAFFDIMWKGWLSPATPVLTNMGNSRGHPISCSGTYIGDSIRSFYEGRMEIAQLTQRGYGTSAVLDAIRHRGAPISNGGEANGIMQVAEGLVQDSRDVSQGSTRRGQVGQYLNPLHPDFEELNAQLRADDEDWNVGWNITDDFEELFNRNPEMADDIWKKVLKTKVQKGKGYFFFLDKVNRNRPKMYQDKGLFVRGSNLCGEITLFNDEKHTFTCVLSSMNVAKYDEWKDTKAIQIATVFLDAVIDDMLIKAKKEKGFERVIAFTEKTRAIGLGILGLTTYFQMKRWVFGDIQSMMFNNQIVDDIERESLIASKLLAREVGEPEWMKGYGERFSHRLAFAPTMSTSIIMGGISQGIEPVYANAYEQDTAGGIVYRINPVLLDLMKERGVYNDDTMKRIAEDQGSIQGEDWLDEHEKKVFKTAFELNQEEIINFSSKRQKIMSRNGGGQSQSLNLYFGADEDEEEIARVHDVAFKDPYVFTLYYIRSLNGVAKHKVNKHECTACEG